MDHSIIISFFPFFSPTLQDNYELIAPFALANYYKEMLIRMKRALKNSGSPYSELKKKEIRLFSNSNLPEKQLAMEGGLGTIGRNQLLIHRTYGSQGLLAGMIIPLPLEEKIYNDKTGCGRCRLCIQHCPGKALGERGFVREQCLQHWTSSDGRIPDTLKKIWGTRIYGCTICQDVCPRNQKNKQGNTIDRGKIEPIPDLDFYINNSIDDVKLHFKGTAMGMSWFKGEHMVRNALLSAAGNPELTDLQRLDELCKSGDDGIRDAAIWLKERLRLNREQ